mgnify:CR=1 FL=1
MRIPYDFTPSSIGLGLGILYRLSERPALTGLLPDFIWVEEQGTRVADPNTIESKYDGSYSYNACRLPYNLVQSKDPVSQKMVKKMLGFFW